LVAGEGRKIPLQIRAGSVWFNREGGAEISIVVPEAVHSSLAPNTEYSLVPANPEDHFRWEVADEVKVVRRDGVGTGSPDRSPAGGESPAVRSSETGKNDRPSRSSTLVLLKTDSTVFSKEEIQRFPHALDFCLGENEFLQGDNITIRGIRGTRPAFEVGGKYLVKGRYTLKSQDMARLCFYRSVKKQVSWTKDHPSQVTEVRNGTGDFSLEKTIQFDGQCHLSFYPVHGGGGGRFGFVYFGQNDQDTWIRRKRR
jgi:hypothetical protein